MAKIHALENVSRIAFTVAFYTTDGSRIMSIDTDIPGTRYSHGKGSNVEVTAFVDAIHLAPTTYMLTIGIRSGDNFMIDLRPELMFVTVLPSDKTPSAIATRNSGHGGVRYPCKTTLHQLARALPSC